MPANIFSGYEMTEATLNRAMGHALEKFRKGIVEAE